MITDMAGKRINDSLLGINITRKNKEQVEELKRYMVDIIGLSEFKCLLIFSGVNKGKAKEGVAFVLRDELFDRIEACISLYPLE